MRLIPALRGQFKQDQGARAHCYLHFMICFILVSPGKGECYMNHSFTRLN